MEAIEPIDLSTLDMSMEACVARGVALLDQVRPGWRDLVNVDRLNMVSSRYCVAGQVFDQGEDADCGYYIARTQLVAYGLPADDSYYDPTASNRAMEAYGFVRRRMGWVDDAAATDALRPLWVAAIQG